MAFLYCADQPIRNASDPEYAQWLYDLGQSCFSLDGTDVPQHMIADIDNVEDTIPLHYPLEVLATLSECIPNSFWSALNIYVNVFDEYKLERLPNEQGMLFTLFPTFQQQPLKVTYYSFDTIKEDKTLMPANHPATAMNCPSLQEEISVPAHELNPKQRCICTIIWNLDRNEGLVKNCLVVVEKWLERIVEVHLIDTRFHRCTFCIPRITLVFQSSICLWTIPCWWFSLHLAYSTTFNSCQSLTLDNVVLDLRTSVFTHGQLYCGVPLVRDRNAFQNIMKEEYVTGTARNVVYQDLSLSR